MSEPRPPLTDQLSGPELARWYWLSSELVAFARALGVATGGAKRAVTARLVAHLDGRPLPDPEPVRRLTPPPLAEPLTAATVLPPGQRCSQQLRRYLTGVIGPGFRFDAPMRAFVARGAGRTLAEAVDHWHRTRSRAAPEIGSQFELNRFLRAWHRDHPDQTHARALDAWRAHRQLPVDARHPFPPAEPAVTGRGPTAAQYAQTKTGR